MTAFVQIPVATLSVLVFFFAVLGLSILPTLRRPAPWPPPLVPGGHPYNKRFAVSSNLAAPQGRQDA